MFFTKKLENRVEELEKTLVVQNALFSSFLSKLESYFKKFEDKAEESSSWLKTLHEMALKEYMSGPKKRVYAFIYNKQNDRENRLILTARDTFEEAHESARISLEKIGENPDRDWTMSSYKFLDVPYGDPDIVDRIEKELPEFVRPLDSYLNSLNLLKDRFCTKASEKKAVDNLIEKVKKSYK